jgi:DNA (cytosine-5)-methyltransferase 1
MICLENVREFEGWGPLDEKGKRIKERVGEEFQRFVEALRQLGYHVEWQTMDASHYGAPTRRKRLFMVARRDGFPIVFPGATHGPGLKPFHTAAECIDWTRECPSIFERKKPLAEKTLWRIAQGIKRFVLENPRPFIVGAGGRARQTNPVAVTEPVGTITTKNDRAVVVPMLTKFQQNGIGQSPDEPLDTVMAGALRFGVVAPVLVGAGGPARAGDPAPADRPMGTVIAKSMRGVVAPHLVKVNHGKREARGESLELPLSTVTAGQRGHALVAPVIARTAHGDVDRNGKRRGQGAHSIEEPIGAVPAGGTDFAVVAPTLVEMNHSNAPHAVEEPLGAVTTQGNRFNLVAASMIQTSYGEREGQRARALDLEAPLGTVVAQGQKHAVVAAFLNKHFGDPMRSDGGGGVVLGSELTEPLGTVTTRDHHTVTAAHLVKMRGECHSSAADEPVPTISAGGERGGRHIAEVRAFLTAYYGDDHAPGKGQDLREPMRTIPTNDRFGLVVVEGVEYAIVDIGFRMLEPDELKRAQFGRFADGYDLSDAKTKKDQIRLIGNSVSPENAEALVAAQIEPGLRRAA